MTDKSYANLYSQWPKRIFRSIPGLTELGYNVLHSLLSDAWQAELVLISHSLVQNQIKENFIDFDYFCSDVVHKMGTGTSSWGKKHRGTFCPVRGCFFHPQWPFYPHILRKVYMLLPNFLQLSHQS